MNALQKNLRSAWPILIALAIAACAAPMQMGSTPNVRLSGSNEVPPVTTAATGSGTITITSDKSVSGSVTTSGINGTAAHIHEGAAGVSGPVIVPLSKTGDNTCSVPAGAKLTD